MVATREYRVIGTRPIRPDGTDKVTGRAEYGADIQLPGLLYGRVKRSPHAHARIKRIDASRALALPGVKAVVTSADLSIPAGAMVPGAGETGAPQPLQYIADAVLARDKALYVGHPVAAVCATDPHVAEDAVELIEVEYEPLPFVQDVREAMAKDAPILHEDLRTREAAPLSQEQQEGATNVAAHLRFGQGDVETGFREADVVIEREFTTSMYHQGYIEPQNGTAFWNRDGKLTVWTSTQGSFAVRSSCAMLLGLPVSQVNVVPMEIGGGFGGKTLVYLEPVAALLSRKTGRPVKVTMSRADVLEATGPTSGTYMRAKIGARSDGTLTACQLYLAYEAGAFPGSPVGAGCLCALGPYTIANTQIDGYDVVLNKPKSAAYRAPGAPASEFAVEAVLNELAKQLDMDPLELRLKNAAREGDRRITGQPYGPIGAVQVMQSMQEHPHYRSELQGENRGRGVAMGFWFNGAGERSVSITLNPDGTVGLVTGNVDIGGTRASIAMMLAETLGIPAEDVKPHVVATDDIGATGMTGGSSSAYSNGWAVHEAGLDLRRKLVERAAKIWEVAPDQVTYRRDGVLMGPSDTEGKPRWLTFKELCAQLPRTGGSISTAVTVHNPGNAPAYAGHIVDVEVDRDTGKVTILRYTAFQDVGTAIHPAYVEGQVQGGAVQGIGMALTEEYVWGEDGRMLNASLLDYRMPTALDLPMIDTVLIEVPNPNHPFGVRGVGEVSIVPPLPAIQAAIADAIDVRLYNAPMSPRVVLEALMGEEG